MMTKKTARVIRLNKAANLAPMIQPICEEIKNTGLYLSREEIDVKFGQENSFEERVIVRVNLSLQRAQELIEQTGSLSQAARILEKIQIYAAEIERIFYQHRTASHIRKAYEIAQWISSLSREFFHEMKERSQQKAA